MVVAKVEIYTSPMCPYCWRAKRLLNQKQVEFVEVDLWRDPERRSEMVSRAGGRTTVPQIFIDDRCIGGCEDLVALEAKGQLDRLVADEASPGRVA
jgi:glutaredoxin 3